MTAIEELLKSAISTEKVFADLNAILESNEMSIDLDSGIVRVPTPITHSVIYKRIQVSDLDMPFMNMFSILVAVGGIANEPGDIPTPVCCYCLLWYNFSHLLVTTDFFLDINAR